MKADSYVKCLFIFLLGAAVGICLPLFFCSHERNDVEIVDSDTTRIYKIVQYSRFDLKASTIVLDVPEVDVPDVAMVPADSTTIVYKDSIRYVVLQRKPFYTKMDDIEIWHSGVDSTIDSVNFAQKTEVITITTRKAAERNSLSFGIEASYSAMLRMPLRLEYSYSINDWLSAYCYGEYEMFRKQVGAGAGMNAKIVW